MCSFRKSGIHTHFVEGHKSWRGECKTMVCDDFSFFCKSAWNFECCFQLNRKTIPCIFSLVCSLFSRYYICKNLYLLSRQCVTAQTVISLKMQQNIDLLQRATLRKCWFQVKTVKILISRKHATAKTLNFPQITCPSVNFMQCASLDNVDFRSFTDS